MNTTIQSIRVGLFFILGLALIYVIYEALNKNHIRKQQGYTVTAAFDDLKQIETADLVRMAGVEIGSVQTTILKEGRALAVLSITDEYQIPKNSVATIVVASLLGRNYVSIRYGDPNTGYLTPGDTILTEESFDFNSILNEIGGLGEKLENFTSYFTGEGETDVSGGLFGKLSALVDENRDKIDRLLTNLDEIINKLTAGEGTLGKLLNEDTAYDEILSAVGGIKKAADNASATFEEARKIVAKMKNGEGTFGKLLTSDELARELDQAVANVLFFTEKLNSSKGTLGLLIEDDSLYVELRGLLQKAERTLDSVGDTGPISAVGVAASALF